MQSAVLTAKDRDVWLVRLYYLLSIGGSSFIAPFISLFYVRRGLTGTEIGLIGTVYAVGQLIAAPLWGRWSDRVSHPRRLIQVGLTGSALAILALSQQTVFLWMAVIAAFDALVGGGLSALSDALALGIGGKDKYGSIRLWGSLGWAGIVLAAGWLIDRNGLIAGFVGYAVCFIVSAGVLALISPGIARRGQEQQDHSGGAGLDALRDGLLRNPAILGLAASLVLLTLTNRPLWQFEAIYLDQLGASETIIGLVSTVGALVEIPAMLWADRLMGRLGPRRLLLIFLAIRVAMMASVLIYPSVPTIIGMRAVGGVGYAFEVVALVLFISEAAPESQRATGLALLTITIPALTGMAGSPLGGLAFDAFGAYWLYAIALGGAALAWAVLRFATPKMR